MYPLCSELSIHAALHMWMRTIYCSLLQILLKLGKTKEDKVAEDNRNELLKFLNASYDWYCGSSTSFGNDGRQHFKFVVHRVRGCMCGNVCDFVCPRNLQLMCTLSKKLCDHPVLEIFMCDNTYGFVVCYLIVARNMLFLIYSLCSFG